MRRTVADRLASARRARFVGRGEELALFDEALRSADPAFVVLWVRGAGGVGKSALLHAFADRARAAGDRPVLLDGRDLEATPAAVLEACGDEVGRADGDGRLLLLFDTFERLAGVEPWIRQSLIPRLPAEAIVVVASRQPPASGWRGDPAWGDLLRVVTLANLPPGDVRAYLRATGVPAGRHERIVALTQGHPLALSLVVDVLAQGTGEAELAALHHPDLVRDLLAQFLDDLPSADHRLALDACALARATTPRHLRAVLGRDDVDPLFDWLRDLSFVAPGPHGLVPHDLAREVLAHELRWRDPERHQRVLLALLRVTGDDLRHPVDDPPSPRALIDVMHSLRSHPELGRYWDFSRLADLAPEPVAPAERAALQALVHAAAGPDDADLAGRWFDLQPDGFRVTRDAAGGIESLAGWIDLTAASDRQRRADPVSRVVWDHVRDHDPPTGAEVVTVCRFLAPSDDPARRAGLSALTSYETMRRALSQPALAWDVFVVEDAAWCGPMLRFCGYEPWPGVTAQVGDRRYALFARNWRTWPAFLARFVDESARPPRPAEPLARPEFDAAVRQALRDLHNPDALAHNPLVTSGAVDGHRLGELLAAAAATLRHHTRDEKLHRAIDRTYFRPAANQELTAELLGLPSSTYRRHLSRAVSRIAEWLWAQAEHRGG